MLKSLKSLPISVKLIATTTVLLTFTVGLYGLMNLQDLTQVYDDSRVEQQEIVLQASILDARNVTQAMAGALQILMAQGAAYGDMKAMFEKLRRSDERLVFVAAHEGKDRVASAGSSPSVEALQRDPRTSEETDGIKVEVFRRGGEPALVRAVQPVKAGDIEGRVEAAWSIVHIAQRAKQIGERLEERKSRSIKNAVFLGGMIILLGLVLTVLQSLRISRPIRELTQRVERIAHGDLGERAIVDSNDEIGVLGRNFNYMAERLGVLLQETKEKATLEKELEVARVIQESLLPPSRIIEAAEMEFIGYFKSASICGGDWWNYAELSNGRLLMLIGDVTGHGVSSAMITAAAKSCCDTLRHVTDGELTVTFLLEELNKTIYEAANRKFVMTFFATVIDSRAQTITFSNAGHNFPLLFRADPKDGEPAIVPLVTRGNRLGDVMESRFLERTVPYEPGDVLVWYTDGITEGLGQRGDEYGEKRFRRSIASVLDRPVDEILEKVIRDAEAFFTDFTRPEDDITLVVGKFATREPAQDHAKGRPQRTVPPSSAPPPPIRSNGRARLS